MGRRRDAGGGAARRRVVLLIHMCAACEATSASGVGVCGAAALKLNMLTGCARTWASRDTGSGGVALGCGARSGGNSARTQGRVYRAPSGRGVWVPRSGVPWVC